MTKNQIEYWKNQESIRSNLAREVETNRSNLADEAERNRHNLATERQARDELANTTLRDYNNFQLSLRDQQEAIRSNKAKENETVRSNKARERETILSRLADSGIRRRQNSIADYNARTSRSQQQEMATYNARQNQINLLNLQEMSRANQAREQENFRSNLANEQIGIHNANLRGQELSETRRRNVANEQITMRGQTYQLIGSLANTISRTLSSYSPKKGAIINGKW